MSLAGTHPESLVGIKRFLFNKVFQLKPEFDKGATALQKHLGILYEPFVGVHIRRGDKLAESHFFRGTEDFAGYALELCDTMNATKVFVASDDPNAANEVRAWFEAAVATDSRAKNIEVVSQPPLQPWQYNERGGTYDNDTMINLLYDISLLVRANAYVGTASSSLDRWVWLQRDPSEQSITLDDAGQWLRRNC